MRNWYVLFSVTIVVIVAQARADECKELLAATGKPGGPVVVRVYRTVHRGRWVVYESDVPEGVRSERHLGDSSTRSHGRVDDLSGETRLPEPGMKPLTEGSYSSVSLAECSDGPCLRIKEYHSVQGWPHTRLPAGLGFEIEASIRFAKGSLEDFRAGREVEFEVTDGGARRAAAQLTRAVAASYSADGLFHPNRGNREASEEVGSMFSQMADQLGAPVRAFVSDVAKTMVVKVMKAPDSLRLRGRGTRDNLAIEYPPEQEFEVLVAHFVTPAEGQAWRDRPLPP